MAAITWTALHSKKQWMENSGCARVQKGRERKQMHIKIIMKNKALNGIKYYARTLYLMCVCVWLEVRATATEINGKNTRKIHFRCCHQAGRKRYTNTHTTTNWITSRNKLKTSRWIWQLVNITQPNKKKWKNKIKALTTAIEMVMPQLTIHPLTHSLTHFVSYECGCVSSAFVALQAFNL